MPRTSAISAYQSSSCHYLVEQIQTRIIRKVVPEIRKASQFEASQLGRLILASHDAGERRGSGVHRDSTVTATQHYCRRRTARPVRLRPAYADARRPRVVPGPIMGTEAIDPGTVGRILKQRVGSTGFDPDVIGGHSLKHGALRTGLDCGIHPTRLKQLGPAAPSNSPSSTIPPRIPSACGRSQSTADRTADLPALSTTSVATSHYTLHWLPMPDFRRTTPR